MRESRIEEILLAVGFVLLLGGFLTRKVSSLLTPVTMMVGAILVIMGLAGYLLRYGIIPTY